MNLFYPKLQNTLFQLLERSQRPHAIRFVPEYGADDGSERGNEQVLACETLHQKQEISHVENGGEKPVEKVSWKEKLAQLNVVPQHTYLHFADQNIVAAYVLFLNQPQLAQLFKMMISHAWAAKVQSPLDFPHAHGPAGFQQKPVDFPSFTSKRVLKFFLISNSQSARRPTHKT